jgi:hypothetical protein
VAEALRFVEDRALFTREGTGGVRQVDVTGLVAAAFTHRDSRAGDPDLHTHVAVANKVQTLAGRWLSIDGRVLHSAKVAASETYNTSLEYHLTASLGVRFAERPGRDRSKRPVREIVGVDPRLTRRWSARRQVIDVRRGVAGAGRGPGGGSSGGTPRHLAVLAPVAETQRQLRGAAIDPADTTHVTAAVVDKAITRSIRLTRRGVQVPLWSGDHP